MYTNREDIVWDEDLVHYGVKYRSGRYPYGSGEVPYQHDGDNFLNTIRAMRNEINPETGQKYKDSEIAKFLGMTQNEMINRAAYLNEVKRNASRAKVKELTDKGLTPSEICEALGMPKSKESTIRGIQKQIERGENQKILNTANTLADAVHDKGMVDIGPGTSNLLKVTDTKLKAAVQLLKDDGYVVDTIHIPQASDPTKNTTMLVLAEPGTTKADMWNHREEIEPIYDRKSDDDGMTFTKMGLVKPQSIDSKRIYINYTDETGERGGIDKDGVIEIRPGVEDLSLGENHYAQVRIGVDDTHYLKGMALYSDNIPEGYDIVFNTNKKVGTPPEKVFKSMKTIVDPSVDKNEIKRLTDEGKTIDEIKKELGSQVDWDNPFGSSLKTEEGVITGQSYYTDSKTGEKKLSAINICRAEGDWDTWDKNLASQFLSKQYPATAKRQLAIAYGEKEIEFEKIKSLTNPEIRKKLLEEFADECDSDAVHMKGAMMPRQTTKVLLPIPSLKDNECYTPGYPDGEQLCLIRYPHGGTFEIPLVYNNTKNKEGRSVLGNDTQDAIGINRHVASILSGADNDGDTVIVFPVANQRIKTTEMTKANERVLQDMRNFSPSIYELPEGAPKVGPKAKGGDGFNTQKEMGMISNLITDMTQKGATLEEICRATKHSMVVIDAEKHQYDYKQSYIDNGIAELKKRYQAKDDPTKPAGGASTLLSRVTSEERVPHRREVYGTESMTEEERLAYDRGEKVYRESGRTYASGKPIQTVSTKGAEAKDLFDLVSSDGGTEMERIYATHGNKLKALGNEARKEARNVETTKVNPAAKEVYATEVKSLMSKIDIAMQNKPYERQAQTLADVIYKAKCDDNPHWTKEDKKKAHNMALNQARRATGANKRAYYVDITDREWEAIMNGAVSSSNITKIINNTDEKKFKERALPRESKALTNAQIAQIKRYLNAGETIADVAAKMGISTSTVSNYS